MRLSNVIIMLFECVCDYHKVIWLIVLPLLMFLKVTCYHCRGHYNVLKVKVLEVLIQAGVSLTILQLLPS